MEYLTLVLDSSCGTLATYYQETHKNVCILLGFQNIYLGFEPQDLEVSFHVGQILDTLRGIYLSRMSSLSCGLNLFQLLQVHCLCVFSTQYDAMVDLFGLRTRVDHWGLHVHTYMRSCGPLGSACAHVRSCGLVGSACACMR